jgi:hypothetical protein
MGSPHWREVRLTYHRLDFPQPTHLTLVEIGKVAVFVLGIEFVEFSANSSHLYALVVWVTFRLLLGKQYDRFERGILAISQLFSCLFLRANTSSLHLPRPLTC